jgi:hypothetical protein
LVIRGYFTGIVCLGGCSLSPCFYLSGSDRGKSSAKCRIDGNTWISVNYSSGADIDAHSNIAFFDVFRLDCYNYAEYFFGFGCIGSGVWR